MAKTRNARVAHRGTCACLPEAMPEEVRRVVDDAGGLEGLMSGLPDRRAIEAEVEMHRALADPFRVQIVHMLALSPLCVCVLRAAMGIPDSKLSYHLGVLRSAGLVTSRKRGSFIIYSLTERGSRWLAACGK